MALRSRFALIAGAIFLAYVALDFAVQRLVVFPNFVALEHRQARQDIHRCLETLARETHLLSKVCLDWATWDDTYRFIQDRNHDYLASNLPANIFQVNEINALYFYDSQGRLVWGGAVAERFTKQINMSDSFRPVMPRSHPLLSHAGTGSSLAGMMLTNRGPMLVASRPITTSEGKGPIRGTLIMGRLLGPGEIQRIRGQTQMDVFLDPLAAEAQTTTHALAIAPITLQEHGPGVLEASTTYPDIFGAPAVGLRIELSRDITRQGRSAREFASLLAVIAGALVLFVLLAVIQTTVVRRLTRFTDQVMAIGRTGDLSARLNLPGRDEVATLATEFDRMLAQLGEARRELISQSRELQAIVDSIPCPMLTLDAQLKVLSANRLFLEMPCREAGDPLGRSITEVLPSDLLVRQNLAAAMEAAVSRGGDEMMPGLQCAGCPEGTRIFDVRVCGFRVSDSPGDEASRVLLVIDDVTHQHSLEEQLRQAAKLEAIGTLAGGVAHDFNNILTGIGGYTHFALEQVAAGSPIHQDLTQVRKLAERAAGLTRQLLAFSRRQPLEFATINLNELIAGTIKMLRRLIGENMELAFRPGPDLGWVRADSGQIEQVLMNLAVNACDAITDGGVLAIATSEASLSSSDASELALEPGDYVRLVVSDDGCGMDEATRGRVFEPFFTTKEVGKGTGLGLATVYGIVKQHGGSIEVDSAPGLGTTFTIYLPRVANGSCVDREPPPSHALEGAETILLVEDEASVLQIATRLLVDQGYRVLSADSPWEAEEVFTDHQQEIGLLLTDVVMPGLGGRELFERLAARKPDLKVVYMSGYPADAIFRQGLLDAQVRLVRKPFSPMALAQAVREVLDGPDNGNGGKG